MSAIRVGVALKVGAAAAVLLGAGTLQAQMTGVSKPEPVVIQATDDDAAAQQPKATTERAVPRPLVAHPEMAKPSAAKTLDSGETYGAYVPYAPAMKKIEAKQGGAFDPDANIVTEATAYKTDPADTDDSQIVTSVPEREGEIREGTLIRARVKQDLSTLRTLEGTKFTAELVQPVTKDGRVILPVGALLDGRITEVHGGRRISGQAAMHLEPRAVTLPDGTHYLIHAQLIDTGETGKLRVDTEGTIKRREHPKEILAVMSMTTGGAAAAGGMLAGGPGAVVGAGIGAGVSTVMWLKEDRQATVTKDTMLVFSLTSPMVLQAMGSGGAVSMVERQGR